MQTSRGLALACTLLYRAASSQTCAGLDKLAVQISWFSQPEFAGWEIPNAQVPGAPTYDSECLQVQVRPGGPDFDPVDELVQRKADVATADAAGIAFAINRGLNFTIVANYFQRATLSLISLEAGQSIRDLNNSNVGIWCCGYDIPIRMMLAAAGVNVNFVDQSFSLSQLYRGDIKAASVMSYNEMALALQKVNPVSNFLRQQDEISIFDPTNLNVPFLHNSVVVLTERLPELRDKLIRLFRVVNRAWLFCRDNERECAEAYPRSGAHYMWQMRVINQVIFPSQGGLGVTQESQWDDMVRFLIGDNQLSSIPALNSSAVIDNSMILASHSDANYDVAKVTGNFTNASVRFCAPYGSDSASACDTTIHTLCPVGTYPVGPGQCDSCPAGRFSYERGAQTFSNGSALPCEPQCPARMLTCEMCPEGRFRETPGASACDLCPRGRFRNATAQNSSGCELCAPGQAATESGSTSCKACPPGTYRSSAQDVECLDCGRGNFSAEEGASACQRCREKMTTLAPGIKTESLCVCPADTYRDLGGNCVECKRGMTCAAGSSEQVLLRVAAGEALYPGEGLEYPKLLPGYWTKRSEPLSVFLCGLASSCPGTDPETCVDKRLDLACGLCAEGYFHSGGGCAPCNALETSGFLYPWMPTIFGPPLVLFLYSISRDRVEVAKKKWSTVVAACAFLTLLHYQSIALLRGFTVNMPSGLSDIMSPLGVLVDLASVLHPECMGYREFSKSILLKVASPLHAVAVFVVVYVGSRMLTWTLGKYGINSELLFSVCMTVVQTFFVPIAFMGLQIFMCYRHPNGESSLNVAPQVLCGSKEWQSVVGLGVAAILLYVVGLLAMFSWVLAVAPGRYNNLVFRSRWKFLLLRQRVGMWWWSLAVLLKGLSLSLSQVIFQRGALQAYWTFFTLLLYAGGLFANPWLHPYANFVDTFGTFSLLFFVACVLWFTAEGAASEPGLRDTVATFAQILSFLPLLAMATILPMSVYSWHFGQRDLGQRQADATEGLLKGANDLMQINPVAIEAFLKNLSVQDFNTLWAGRNIFLAELFGQQPGVGFTGFLDWRLVLDTDDRRRSAAIDRGVMVAQRNRSTASNVSHVSDQNLRGFMRVSV